MADSVYTDEQLDHQRKMFREAARETTHKTFVPVENAGQVADMLDDLADRRKDGDRPCKACGERVPTKGGYCREHR